MRHVIWKYEVPVEDLFTLILPRNAKILKFDTQHNVPMLWILSSGDTLGEQRTFRLIGTGHPIHDAIDQLNYIDSTQTYDGQLVWHLFEVLS